MASKTLRVGNRYYEVAEGYDKRVYENECSNYLRIFVTLCGFWTFNGLHWWACFELGMWNSNAYMIYSLCIFGWTICFLAGMLCSGKGSNKVLRELSFLKEVIEEEKAKVVEKEEKVKTEKEYERKIAESKAKAEAEAAAATPQLL